TYRIMISLVTVLLFCSGVNANEGNAMVTVKIDVDKVLEENFLGVGVQCSGYPWFDVSDADWQKVFERMDYLKMPFTRIMVDWTNFFEGLDADGSPQYSFESQKMRNTYKLLDYCQANDITVMFGQWGWINTVLHAEGQNWDIQPDSKLHARMSADLIDYVVNKKGYSCIQWFDPINEPDGFWSSCDGDWPLWTRVAKQLHQELITRGLTAKIRISGPADVYMGWIPKALDDKELHEVIAVYNEHKYLWNKDVVAGQLETQTRQQVNGIQTKDPGKQYFAGEVGFLDGKNKKDQNVEVKNFWYGVSMADAAIQMMRGGASGFLAWYLDDAMHWHGDSDGPIEQISNAYEMRKIWGMWNILGAEHGDPQDEAPRPWFYPWSQLSRNFPAGAKILDVPPTGIDHLRVTAAKISSKDTGHLSVAVVNNSDQPKSVKIVVPTAKQEVALNTFEYFDADNDNKVDSWQKTLDSSGHVIYPEPTKTLREINLASGLTVQLPTKGVVILTTLRPAAASPVDK
ncbi:MAG: hypothetical protein ACYSOV_05220, partial [Planctomycetota bacterium]